MADFTHLHVHTQYSILDGASSVSGLMDKACRDGMKALAITDHGNMYGVFDFYTKARKKGIKPILGCEVYVAPEGRFVKKGKENRHYHHLVLLAKNKTGYYNLCQLVSLGFIEGFYYRPRIDRELLGQYHEGLIAMSACLAGEIPSAILAGDMDKARETIGWFKQLFGDDFYLEMQRHPTNDPEADQEVYLRQQKVNEALLVLSKETGVKLVASNDVHFVDSGDAVAHDLLLCINTDSDVEDTGRMRYTRQEWLKSPEEMEALFADVPEAIAHTMEIAEKIEEYKLDQDPIMPDFPIPKEFQNADEYLSHLTMEGARKRYKEITPSIQERIDYELGIICRMGFPGYFLIVHDFISAARRMGVWVGPGRGSAAGSVVAYCLGITEVDPLQYGLLFERFLNPDRISMPDIDIDFDNEGRDRVIEYVSDKYGRNRVAQIVTFNSMGAKMAIRDVARVLGLPLPEADRLAKMVVSDNNYKLKQQIEEIPELAEAYQSGSPLVKQTIDYAIQLEGSIRNTGVHACGIIIGRDDLINYIPMAIVRDEKGKDILVTQYEGIWMEKAGLLKMDFLGLKNISIIRNAIELIRQTRNEVVDIKNIPLDDEKTYQLFSRGDTLGIFQFESDGMRKYLRELKPNCFNDLIAMNALFRPGPMQYIPQYCARKHGREAVHYDLPQMEKILQETYGITVYQEQVMLLARELAGFTPGESDHLRKIIGKKKPEELPAVKTKFVEGCRKNGIPEDKIQKIWSDWENFALYAFNKSHSTCYALLAYQTAYLKAHYPAEYMAALLNYSDSIDDITKYMNEARRMGIEVFGPDVNESSYRFTVNNKGCIRFGLGAIKGVGEQAVRCIEEERSKNGPFKDIFDFVERVNLSAVNKKNMEALAMAGAFDSLPGIKRSQYFSADDKGMTFIEHLLRYGNKVQSEKGNVTLFGESHRAMINKPVVPDNGEWSKMEELTREKEVIGIYLSAHPLDEYRFELQSLCTHRLTALSDLSGLRNCEIVIGGMITQVKGGMTKNNHPFGTFVLEDFSGQLKISLFGKDYIAFRNYLIPNNCILIKGKVVPRIYNPLENEIKINEILMLNEASEKMIKSISIKIPLQIIDESFIGTFLSCADKGSIALGFSIYDEVENVSVKMFSRSQRVKITPALIDFLRKYEDVELKIN